MSTTVILQGELEEGTLPHLLEYFSRQPELCGVLQVRARQEIGEIWVQQGAVTAAGWAPFEGEAAIAHMLRLRQGRFEFIVSQMCPPQSIRYATVAALLEAVRTWDEAKARPGPEPMQVEVFAVPPPPAEGGVGAPPAEKTGPPPGRPKDLRAPEPALTVRPVPASPAPPLPLPFALMPSPPEAAASSRRGGWGWKGGGWSGRSRVRLCWAGLVLGVGLAALAVGVAHPVAGPAGGRGTTPWKAGLLPRRPPAVLVSGGVVPRAVPLCENPAGQRDPRPGPPVILSGLVAGGAGGGYVRVNDCLLGVGESAYGVSLQAIGPEGVLLAYRGQLLRLALVPTAAPASSAR